MPSTAEINAQNEASLARQQANRGIVPQAPQQVQQQSPWINPYGTQYGTDSIQDQSYYDNYYNNDQPSPYVNPYGQQYGTDSIQDQSYYDNYYNEEEITEEEWAAYLAELGRRQARLGGFNAPAPVAPTTTAAIPDRQRVSFPGNPFGGDTDIGPSRENRSLQMGAPNPSTVDEFNATIGFDRFALDKAAAPSEMSPMVRAMLEDRLARTNADIVASGGTVPSLGAVPWVPSEVIPRGGVRTLGTGGERSPVAAARTGGIAESKNQFGALETLRNVINPSAEQISANLAANSRVGGVQALPPAAVAAPQPEPQSPFLQSLNMERGSKDSPQSNYYDFVQRGGQMNDEQLRQANEKAMSMGTTFDPETGYSRQPYLDRKNQGPQVQAPMSVRDTQNMLFDRFGSPTVSGNMNPSESGLETDQQGRMIPGGYADRVEAYLPYEQDAYDREVNQANRRDFSEPFISGADSRDAGNDTPDFRTMARLKGFTGSGVNAQAKILEAEWNRLEEASGANTPESRQVEMRYKMAQTTKILNEISRDNGMTDLDKEVVKDLVPKYNEWRTTEETQSKSNINKLTGIIRSLDAGDVETGGFINKLPVFSDQARLVFDPSGSDAVDRIRGVAYQSLRATLGAQFTENEGKNLVATYFNPGLDSKMNMDRLIEFSQTMQAVHNSKTEMYQYLDDNQSLKGYKPKNPRGMVESLVNGGSSNRTSAVRANNGAGATRTTSSGATVTLMDSK